MKYFGSPWWMKIEGGKEKDFFQRSEQANFSDANKRLVFSLSGDANWELVFTFLEFLNVEKYWSWICNSGFLWLLIRKLGKIYFFIKHYFPRKFFLVFENHEMQPTILLQRVATLMEVLFFLPQKMGLHFSHHLQQASTHKFSASYSLLPPLFFNKKV